MKVMIETQYSVFSSLQVFPDDPFSLVHVETINIVSVLYSIKCVTIELFCPLTALLCLSIDLILTCGHVNDTNIH